MDKEELISKIELIIIDKTYVNVHSNDDTLIKGTYNAASNIVSYLELVGKGESEPSCYTGCNCEKCINLTS